jgi:DoxX-like family
MPSTRTPQNIPSYPNQLSCQRLGGLDEPGAIDCRDRPAAVHIAPILVPLAAVGLALMMAGAITVHARRKETMNIAVNMVLIALAIFLAWARSGPYSFAP